MSLSISQHNPFYSQPLRLEENRNNDSSRQPDTARHHSMDNTGGAHRTKRDTPPTSSEIWHYSDKSLLIEIAKYYSEYTAGTADSYVRIQDLEEAAGQLTASRSFSQGASEAAKELLARPKLLEVLDIGVGFFGPGLKDKRFDRTNLNWLTSRASDRPRIRIAPRNDDD